MHVLYRLPMLVSSSRLWEVNLPKLTFIACSSSHIADLFDAILSETGRQLGARVGEYLSMAARPTLFRKFTGSLSELCHSPGIHSLPEMIEKQMQRIVEVAFAAQGNRRLHKHGPAWQTCFGGVSLRLIQPYKMAMLPLLEGRLAKVALLVESIETFHEIKTRIQGYSFSPTCITMAARLKFCTHCSGYPGVEPCPSFCMNTFQGCVEDFAQFYPSYATFVNTLKPFFLKLSSEFQPESLLTNSFGQFLTLAKDLSRISLKEKVSIIL